MKKILFVANVAKEHIMKFHLPTIKTMKELGWIVDVACSGDEVVPYCDNQYHTCWKRTPFTIKTIKGIRELKTILKNNNYDIVYCHTPVGALIARLASRKFRKTTGLKVVYMVHGFHFYKGAPLINWIIYYPAEKILSKLTNAMIVISQEDRDNALKKLKCKNVKLVYGMGIDLDSFFKVDIIKERSDCRNELNIPQDAFVMVYLAELIPNKNQGMIIEALKNVISEMPNTYLILAGIDHADGKFQKLAKDLHVDDHVRFLGWRNDKERLYAAADLCTPTSIREGFGLNLVEAMAFHLPIVATNNRGHRTIVDSKEKGQLVEIGDVKMLSSYICRYQQGKLSFIETDISKYDEKNTVAEIIRIIESI